MLAATQRSPGVNTANSPDDRCNLARPESKLRSPRPPLPDELVRADPRVLRPPRRQRGRLSRASAGRSALGHRGIDLSAPPAERPHHVSRHTDDLRDPLPHRRPLDAELARQLTAQHRLVDEARRPRVRIQPPPIERRPPPIEPAPEIRHEHVRVELRIAGARRPMPERRGDQPRCLLDDRRRHARGERPPPSARDTRPPRASRCHAPREHARVSSSSPIPKSTLTLFGAENVRSNPATRARLDELRSSAPLDRMPAVKNAPKRVSLDVAAKPELTGGRSQSTVRAPRAARGSSPRSPPPTLCTTSTRPSAWSR